MNSRQSLLHGSTTFFFRDQPLFFFHHSQSVTSINCGKNYVPKLILKKEEELFVSHKIYGINDKPRGYKVISINLNLG